MTSLFGSTVLGAAVCSALLAFCGGAAAQRAALVQDRDSPGRAPYQNEVGVNPSNSICPNPFFCVITFPAVPAGMRLVVTHASVEFTNGIGGPGVGYITGPGGIFGPRLIIPNSVVTPNNRTIASGQVSYYVEAGQTPQVIFSGFKVITSNSAFASLVGYLVTLP